MLEAEMYPLFANWLEVNTDLYVHELLIIHCANFDFIAIKGPHIVVYELKIRDARRVILQANRSRLWADHSYCVMPEQYIHLAIKRRHLFYTTTGLLALNMNTGAVREIFSPEYKSHATLNGLRQAMYDMIIEDAINSHQHYISAYRQHSAKRRRMTDRKETRRGSW